MFQKCHKRLFFPPQWRWGLLSLGGFSAFYGKSFLDLVAFALVGSQEFITICWGHVVVAILLAAYSNNWEYGLILMSCSHNQNKKADHKKPVWSSSLMIVQDMPASDQWLNILKNMVGGKNVEKDVIGNRKEYCFVMSKVGNIRKRCQASGGWEKIIIFSNININLNKKTCNAVIELNWESFG